MPQIPKTSVESSFIGGLKTEFTGLNFPENACTDTDNCVFDLVGNVTRRPGFDYETNYQQTTINRTNKALSEYKWNNVGGDGQTQIIVEQVGGILYFYTSSAATVTSPLSTQIIVAQAMLSGFIPAGSTNVPDTIECQYADGNGYLFVYHPYLDPFYCTYSAGTISFNTIPIKIRDFNGLPDTLGVAGPGNPATRPTTLSNEHNYNIQNQGWGNSATVWVATSTAAVPYYTPYSTNWRLSTGTWGPMTVTIDHPANVIVGQAVNLSGTVSRPSDGSGTYGWQGAGFITGFDGTSVMTINITSAAAIDFPDPNPPTNFNFTISPSTASVGLITGWHSTTSTYPSNTDVWFAYKNSSGVFDLVDLLGNVVQPNSLAPNGHFILNAFNLDRTIASGVPSLTVENTYIRPSTGTWFQGRTWFTGVNASQTGTGDVPYYTWTENIYFSQIITNTSQFGFCYQQNDPTDENLFGELPDDGGVITIQGCGSIYKLFPIQNGLLVFAANGIWFITGSQGIGFTANDYTITKISQVQSISSTSFVNVQGLPIFWNEEGIYAVEPAQQGLGLTVNPITVGTILSFYASIPLQSKKYVRGDYSPIDYIIKWVYRSTNESSVTDRYQFDSVLNFNTYNKAFYPYSLSGTPFVHSVRYVSGPGGSTSPDPTFKFFTSALVGGSYNFTFSEENSSSYLDWFSFDGVGTDYTSYFVTGYKLHGQALRQWQPEYVYMYSNNPSSYIIQGIWNFANSGNSGKYSSRQLIVNNSSNFDYIVRRHKIRGHGLALQIKVESVSGQPFDIIGWAIWEQINAGV